MIGITTYVTPAKWSYWELDAALVPAAYGQAVEAAGGRPLLIPPSNDGLEETLDALDGLIFSGGSDLDPETYGAEPHPETTGIVPERDRFELSLLQAALARDMPVLAICRGSQVLNVARGGDLVQHLPDVVGHEEHKLDPGVFGDHEVRLAAGSRAGALLGERCAVKSHHHQAPGRLGAVVGEHAPVKSHHHQGFGRVGDGLRPVAWADDGTVEALEDSERRFALGVLWHPEAGEDLGLFRGVVEAAREYRTANARQ